MVEQTEATTKTNKKATGSRKAGATKTAGKSAAAKAPTKTANKANGSATSNRGGRSAAGSKGGAKKSSQRGGQNKGQQQQAAPQRQGEGTMSPQSNGGGAPTPMFGGTRQVLIEEVAMTNRGGRKQGPEPYPFGDLSPSRIGEGGAIIGPSFFIPDSENPKKIIAAGRKRHKGAGKVFLTRQMEGPSIDDPNVQVSGVRVWLAPEGYGQ